MFSFFFLTSSSSYILWNTKKEQESVCACTCVSKRAQRVNLISSCHLNYILWGQIRPSVVIYFLFSWLPFTIISPSLLNYSLFFFYSYKWHDSPELIMRLWVNRQTPPPSNRKTVPQIKRYRCCKKEMLFISFATIAVAQHLQRGLAWTKYLLIHLFLLKLYINAEPDRRNKEKRKETKIQKKRTTTINV